MSQALHPMLNIAIKAARAAGAIINRASLDLDLLKVNTKAPNDFVTEVDQAAEQAIIETLLTRLPGPRHPGRGVGPRARREGQRLRLDHRSAGRHHQLHPRLPGLRGVDRAGASAARCSRPWSTTRRATTCSTPPRAAAPSSTTSGCASPSARAWPTALIGTGFPFRKGDNFKRYVKMFEEVMQNCAGLRRPGAAALDLCYVAAGYYDGFFETGLNPWDIAAGSLMITEAGGLIGNFTGEADFLYQREVVAGNPKVYGQLVQILAPYTRVIKADEPASIGDRGRRGARRRSRRRPRWPPPQAERAEEAGRRCASARPTRPATTTHRSEPRGSRAWTSPRRPPSAATRR